MSFQEWLSGFSLILDICILCTLVGYIIAKREDIWKPHYCVAIGLCIYMSGHSMRTWITWWNLFTHPDLVTQEMIAARFPLVGSYWWMIGSCIAALGLAKLIRTFAESYLNRFVWLVAVSLAALFPLLSLYF